MELKVVFVECFLFTLCVLYSVDSGRVEPDIRVKRYAQNYHAYKKHGSQNPLEEDAFQERFSGPPGLNKFRGNPHFGEPKAQKGNGNGRGPDGKGPPGHNKGPPANKGPPPNRGPPDHRGPPNKGPPNETREPNPNIDIPHITQNPFIGQNVTPLPPNNVNTMKPQTNNNECNPTCNGNIAIYQYEGKPVFQVIPVTPES